MTALVGGCPLKLDLGSLSGSYGVGLRRLVAEVVTGPPVAGEPVFVVLTAELAVAPLSGAPVPLGAGRFDQPLVLDSFGGRTVRMTFDMTDGQVEQIEVLRNGADLELSVKVAGLSHHPDRSSDLVNGYYKWTVSSTTWAAALEQAGAFQTASVTLLLPVDGPGRDRPRVAAELRDARQALADGRWSDAIIGCRHVLELAGLTDTAFKEVKKKQQRSKDQRYAALADALVALYDLASAAAHRDDVTSPFDWGRADATAAVACCVALLHQHDAATRRP